MAVIGAGPAGSMAAKYAAKAGASTVLLEEHAAAGWPVQCAGLLGGQAMAESELSPGPNVLRGMMGASVFSPGGQRLDFKAKSCKAWVVDRRLFDRAMLAPGSAGGSKSPPSCGGATDQTGKRSKRPHPGRGRRDLRQR